MKLKKILRTAALAWCICITATSLCSCIGNKYKVDLVTDKIGGIDDSFNQPAIEGLKVAEETYSVKTTKHEAQSIEDFDKIFEEINNSDLVICMGYKVLDNVTQTAAEHSDINYVAIDCEFIDSPDNLVGICYRVEESSFLVGYIAGMTTETDKVGFVGGMEVDTVRSFEYGYRAGVMYAASQLSKEIEVVTAYTGTFSDVDAGYDEGMKMYDDDCDIVFQAAGNSGTGVINAAKETGKYVIGVDVDQSYLAPKNVLTSALKDIKSTVIMTVNDYKSGSMYKENTKYIGLKENGVGIPKENPLVNEEVLVRTYELRDLIINGSITPPDTEAEYFQFLKTL